MPKPPAVQTTDLDQTPQYTPSAMASPHLTGGLSRDVTVEFLSGCRSGSRLFVCSEVDSPAS